MREWNEEKHSRVEGGATAGQFGTGTGPMTARKEKTQRAGAALSPKLKARAEAKRQAERVAQQTATGLQAAEEKQAAEVEKATPSKKKKLATRDDFAKAKVRFRMPDPQVEEFLTSWNEKIGMNPEEFVKTFTGGLQDRVDMSMGKSGNEFQVTGIIKDENGRTIGNFDRDIKPDKKEAYSAYFKIEKAYTGDDIGKRILAGNIEAYEAMGIDTVRVSANIDKGGYAWAKYGYVPTAAAWSTLSAELEGKLDRETGEGGTTRGRSTSSDTYEAEEWDMLSSDQQEETFRRWARDSRDEFLQTEIEYWRENGEALESAKRDIAERFNNADAQWAMIAMTELRAERTENQEPDIPYSDDQIMEALTMAEYEFEQSRWPRRFRVRVDMDDKLQAPTDFDPNQKELPGFEETDKSTHLTQDMRDVIIDKLTKSADTKADETLATSSRRTICQNRSRSISRNTGTARTTAKNCARPSATGRPRSRSSARMKTRKSRRWTSPRRRRKTLSWPRFTIWCAATIRKTCGRSPMASTARNCCLGVYRLVRRARPQGQGELRALQGLCRPRQERVSEMAKIHGAEKGERAREFFYTDDEGNMYDADLHDPILFGGDNQIDETIMAPIRKRFQKKYANLPLKNKAR